VNLHSIVAGAIAAVNPRVTGQYQQSNGTQTLASGKRVPDYLAATPITVQLQALTYKDLVQVDGLNLNGQAHAMYVSGDIEAVVRQDNKGGDIITLPDGSIWLVVHVLENWQLTSGWAKVAVVRQSS
jgi:hypothetical protein